MNHKKIITVFLSLSLLLCSYTTYAEQQNATRGDVVSMLLNAADDYNPTVQKTDIIKGYSDGQLHEERNVTRAEALVMLKRAFGDLPDPIGHNARIALTAKNFTDIPDWAKAELEDIFKSGIVAGTSDGIFSPNNPVTIEQMNLFIDRIYSLYGTNLKDDFYATVNKSTLDNSIIYSGLPANSVLIELNSLASLEIYNIINDCISTQSEVGSKEQKIADLYKSIIDTDSRNAIGIAPIKKYLDLINSAKNTADLIDIQNTMYKEINIANFVNFSITVDLKDSTKYVLYFETASPLPQKDIYIENSPYKDTYINYMKTILSLAGNSEEQSSIKAEKCYDFEKKLSESEMNIVDKLDINKIYNIYTMENLTALFPQIDLDSVFISTGLQPSDKILVTDPKLMEAFSKEFNNSNIDTLKAYAEVSLLVNSGLTLNTAFTDAAQDFEAIILGTEGRLSIEDYATSILQQSMPDYLSELYIENNFSEEAKEDVSAMVDDIINVFKSKIKNTEWMSDITKEKAIKKLDAMNVKIGYPDNWSSYLDDVEIKSPDNGGSFFENLTNILKATQKEIIKLQQKPIDNSEWAITAYTVNSIYNATSNDITFPAAIIQEPFYDVNASYEQNLGGIGYIIAHEITHAFDNTGAKFDENGNATDWWTPDDYTAFENLCNKMVESYDGEEAIPGISVDGNLTLGENVADQGAISCITEIASKLENPDYKTLYTSLAQCWSSTATREYYEYISKIDTHSPDKLRVNKVIATCDEFYKAFDIDENDGMYIKPEERIKIW